MKKTLFLFFIFSISFLITSCEKDEEDNHNNNGHNNSDLVAPDTYNFERDGVNTVYFSGQTCRLEMADSIYGSLNNPSYTILQIMQMFDDGTGFPVEFECGKNVGSKTAASPLASSTVKGQFNDMVEHLVNNVYPHWTDNASMGVAGQITTSTGSIYQVDAKGLEIDQAFIKGLIGALCVDQITNNYLTASKLDGDGTTNDINGLGAGEYTNMEHYWDEGFGYLYGRDNQTNPALGVGVLLNKYLKKVNNSNEPGIANVIYDAFKLGRAAIVAGDYTIRDEQSVIIKNHIDKVIAYKAVDYLTEGAQDIINGYPREDTFHGLSEGYGFILSLQFTNYFSNSQVNDMLDVMMDNNGFWDISAVDLNDIADEISTAAGL
jgi:hypothetical protein